jgi:methylenetetrahydrofolate--tRNA-(uracil-5-)-methyltransferase
VIARRGFLTLAFGTFRPIGLVDPRTGRRPFAVCQLRRETRSGESYGLVGCQTRLRIAEQQRVFRMVPGLANAEFLSYGSIHRNTYLDSPRLLRSDLSFRERPELFLAGQLCGGEGYTESILTGHLAARAAATRLAGQTFCAPPATTLSGALLSHVTSAPVRPFTPSNANFGLLVPLEQRLRGRGSKQRKKQLLAERAIRDLEAWVAGTIGNRESRVD